jgi:hypothetical protein
MPSLPKKSSIKKTSKTSSSNSKKTIKTRKTIRRSSARKSSPLSKSSKPPVIDYDSLTRELTTPQYQEKYTPELNGRIISPAPFPEEDSLTEQPIFSPSTQPTESFDYTHELIPTRGSTTSPRQRTLLIGGVLGFFCIILAFWIWNLKIRFANITFAAGADHNLLADTKETWQKAFADTTTTPTIDTEKLKATIATFLTSSSTSSTVSESTSSTLPEINIPTSTSSTISITSPTSSTPLFPIPTTPTPTSYSTSTVKSKPETLPISKPRRK